VKNSFFDRLFAVKVISFLVYITILLKKKEMKPMEINDPAFDYDKFGQKYSGQRRTDPRIEKYVHDALGSAKTVLNVGAGAKVL
jgi:hypothetical protein